MTPNDTEKLIQFETKISHHEVAIEELQETTYQQHLTIEKLEKALRELTKRLDEAMAPEIGPGNQKPPHY